LEQRRSDVSQHHHTRDCRCNGATPEASLRRREKIVVLAVLETRFEPLREISGQLYRRKISEKEKSTANFYIVLRAAFTLHKVSLHANQLDTCEGIVYKGNVLITKLATVHGDRLRVR
jgi:hypothetical protein